MRIPSKNRVKYKLIEQAIITYFAWILNLLLLIQLMITKKLFRWWKYNLRQDAIIVHASKSPQNNNTSAITK